MDHSKTLFLCGGLPSSGSTLVSWCFLQRPDTDGVLDAINDVLPELPQVQAPNLWCKTTIGSFRFLETIEHFTDLGYDVKPILMVRDLRNVFNSLLNKPYSANGTTAEEPPLRLRMRRFLSDWRALRNRATIIQYEALIGSPDTVLRDACTQLGLDWSGDMLIWPKAPHEIADASHGSPTFRATRGNSFVATVDSSMADLHVQRIPKEDLEWLNAEFAEFNATYGYPLKVPRSVCKSNPAGRAEPTFANTRRYRKHHTIQRLVGRKMTAVTQAVQRSPLLSSVSQLGKPAKSQENYFNHATFFAD